MTTTPRIEDDESGGHIRRPTGPDANGTAPDEDLRTNDDDHRGQRPLLVTVRDAAALLGIGRTTAYELIADGELEVVHIRRAVRVPVAAIEDYVARLRQRAS